jgi:hypothetical protein
VIAGGSVVVSPESVQVDTFLEMRARPFRGFSKRTLSPIRMLENTAPYHVIDRSSSKSNNSLNLANIIAWSMTVWRSIIGIDSPFARFAARFAKVDVWMFKLACRHSHGSLFPPLPVTNAVLDEVAVGTIISDRPPHRSARALISACGSYLG